MRMHKGAATDSKTESVSAAALCFGWPRLSYYSSPVAKAFKDWDFITKFLKKKKTSFGHCQILLSVLYRNTKINLNLSKNSTNIFQVLKKARVHQNLSKSCQAVCYTRCKSVPPSETIHPTYFVCTPSKIQLKPHRPCAQRNVYASQSHCTTEGMSLQVRHFEQQIVHMMVTGYNTSAPPCTAQPACLQCFNCSSSLPGSFWWWSWWWLCHNLWWWWLWSWGELTKING